MEDLLFKYKNEYPPAKGCLLISEPHLPDNNFERSVIFLCEHNEKGSFGLVLNKLSNHTLNQLVQNIEAELPVGIGGPVEHDTLHFLFRNTTEIEGSVNVGDNIYWGGNYNKIANLVNGGELEEDVLFFIGYSGWSEGQLEEEIERSSWIVFPDPSEQLVFNTRNNNLWKEVLKEMGGRFSVFANYPSDPRLN
ncbi:UPF0301 protein YqgE [hydrothermal vent metagenome]|uniref:UPF0301 protein YqgE n=1 Tax=hydrothermal vent metagenome TaxID=652676 RepID=A0A3B1D7Y3_9ZZZZ